MLKTHPMETMVKLILFLIFGVWMTLDLHSQPQGIVEMASQPIPDPAHPAFVGNEILVKFREEAKVRVAEPGSLAFSGNPSLNRILEKYKSEDITRVFPWKPEGMTRKKVVINGTEKTLPSLIDIYRIRMADGQEISEMIRELEEDPSVEFAEPNYIIYSVDIQPDDPIYRAGAQWHLDTICAPAAWNLTVSDTGQVIGIVDTGIDMDHPDLAENIWTNSDEIPGNGIDDDDNGFIDDTHGWDFINRDNDPDDDNSHGTHVAGLAAAVTNNTIGVAGVAWHARIMPVKMLQSSGTGNAADFAAAILYAFENGATIINMSLGSYGESKTVLIALEYAYSNALLVAAAGNDFYNIDLAPLYPACYSFVVGTESSGFNNELAYFSNFDPDGPITSASPELYNYEVRAPGMAIYSTFPNGNYHALSGTSMSSPIVAGAAALLKSFHPGISNEQVFVRFIQGSTRGILNLYKSLTIDPVPDLNFIAYTLVDTLPGCDRDGLADAGETIQLLVKIRNTGRYADSVWARLKFGMYEDTTVAKILDSTAVLGNMSEYSTLGNDDHLFTIRISNNIAHDRDIVFSCTYGSSDPDTLEKMIIVNVQNAVELSGVMDSLKYLTPDRLWIINRSFRIGSHGTLIILPGTALICNKTPVNWGKIYGYGKPDSLIHIRGFLGGGFLRFYYADFTLETNLMESPEEDFIPLSDKKDSPVETNEKGMSDLENYTESKYPGELRYDHCTMNSYPEGDGVSYINCVLNNSNFGRYADSVYRCNFNIGSDSQEMYANYYGYNNFSGNMIFFDREYVDTVRIGPNNIVTTTVPYFYRCPVQRINPQYWGTTDTAWIDAHIYDNEESNEYCPPAVFTPFLTAPTPLAHGMVWKILINGNNPQENPPDPLGAERVRFDVWFNKPMDTSYIPQLSFGVRPPYNQHIVKNGAYWRADSLVWTAYFDVSLETGDGMNYLRAQNARDTEGFEIPIENNKRFKFMIQSAGSASIPFNAIPGIGRCLLRWAHAISIDILGYNLYRFQTNADTLLINSESIITDTTYIDFRVCSDTTYYYFYTIIGTDFKESDPSRIVSCVPIKPNPGDANGDESVNVLDIMTVIAYMLGQDPQPFLFDAADVNEDQSINILDVIGIVNRTLNPEKSGFDNTGTNPAPAYIRLENDRIIFTSEGQVASLQFELTGEGLDKIHLTEPPAGFELAYGIVNGKLLGILYSSTNRNIPAGTIDLVKLRDASVTPEWGTILAGDALSNRVPVLKETPAVTAKPEMYLQAYPNPFSQKVTINFRLIENAKVKISVYTMNGRIVNILTDKFLKDGLYWIDWNGTSFNNRTVPSGIYLCRLEGVTPEGIQFKKETKIVFIR